MNIINLTPHAIRVIGQEWTFDPSGTVARCAVTRESVGTLEGIPVNRTVFGLVENLPDAVPGTVYIVSSLVAQAAKDRKDLVIPDDIVRDDVGRIIGCRAFAQV